MAQNQIKQAVCCEAVDPIVEEYLAGELDAALQTAIENHLAECQRCQAEIDAAFEIDAALQAFPKPQPPAEIFDHIVAHVRSHPKRTSPMKVDWLRRALSGLYFRPLAVGAVSIFLTCIVLFGAYRRHQRSVQIEKASRDLSYALSTVHYAMLKTELVIDKRLPAEEVREAPRKALIHTLDEINAATNDELSQVIHKGAVILNKLNWKEKDES